MFYTVYKITNLINNKYYIGKHQTKKLDDNYMGSGKLLKKAIINFKKEILYVFDNESDMNAKEKELVVICEQSYNLCDGGFGGFSYINRAKLNIRSGYTHSNETIIKIKQAVKSTFTEERRIAASKLLIDNPMYLRPGVKDKVRAKLSGRSLSSDHKANLSAVNKKKMEDPVNLSRQQKLMINARKYTPTITSENTKIKISKAVKLAWKIGKLKKPERNWVGIQQDLDIGMKRKYIYIKYNINKNILDNGIKKNYIHK